MPAVLPGACAPAYQHLGDIPAHALRLQELKQLSEAMGEDASIVKGGKPGASTRHQPRLPASASPNVIPAGSSYLGPAQVRLPAPRALSNGGDRQTREHPVTATEQQQQALHALTSAGRQATAAAAAVSEVLGGWSPPKGVTVRVH